MREKIDKLQLVPTEIVTCDTCGGTCSPIKTCCICYRDACSDCGMFDPYESSDYPKWFCKKCWEMGEPFRDKISDASEVYDNMCDLAWEEWREKANQEIKKNEPK